MTTSHDEHQVPDGLWYPRMEPAVASGPVEVAQRDEFDDLASDLRRTVDAARARRLRRRRVGLSIAGIGAAALLVWGAAALFTGPAGPAESSAVSPAPAVPTVTGGHQGGVTTPPWCAESSTSTRVVGSGPGDRTTGPGVILGFEHGFYVTRDAAAARSMLTPSALGVSEADTAAAIAAIPGGTTHCVQIDVLGPDSFAATILQRSPSGEVATWSLTVATAAQPDGTVLITSITPRAEGQP